MSRKIIIKDMEVVLTNKGETEVLHYLAKLKAKRKEILDAGKDTVDETKLPTVRDILSDIYRSEEDNKYRNDEYWNNWGVTDNYNGDYPLHLKKGIDYWLFLHIY